LGTLNHILVADVVWLKRFIEHGNFTALDDLKIWSTPGDLDNWLYDDLASLKSPRGQMDMMLIGLTNELEDSDLSGGMSFHDMAGVSHRKHRGTCYYTFLIIKPITGVRSPPYSANLA
jgi:hypothetical protein